MSEENNNVETEQVETTENNTNEEQDNTTYTQSELDSHISKAVDSAIKKQRTKWEQEKEQELEQAKNEAAEYAKLTQKEKEEAEYKKRIEQLEQREQELNNRELNNHVASELRENSLPIELSDTLISLQDSEKIKERIGVIKQHIDDVVNEQVKAKLRQGTPESATKQTETSDPFKQILNKYK